MLKPFPVAFVSIGFKSGPSYLKHTMPGLGMFNMNFLFAEVIYFFVRYKDNFLTRECNKNQI